MRETCISSRSVRQPGHDGENGREGYRAHEAEEHVAAHRMREVNRHHVHAADHRAGGAVILRVRRHQGDRAEADDDDQRIADTDDAGGVQDAFSGGLRIAHGKEAHQDVR
jgi:hypothetical protein